MSEGTDKVTVLADGQPVEIEAKPFTVLFHPGEIQLEIPTHHEINGETTLARCDMLTTDEWEFLSTNERFLGLVAIVWKGTDVKVPATVDELLTKRNRAYRHVVGMIIELAECIADGRKIFLREPETHLHPKQQMQLVDMLRAMQSADGK